MPDAHGDFEAGLQRVLLTLRPYLPDLVLIGGWVPFVYRRYGGHTGWLSGVSFTRELDILSPGRLPPAERRPIVDLLRAAGLKPKAGGEPAAVWRSEDPTGDEIEFFIPQARPLRRGQATASVSGQPGLAAIELPDLGVLERHTRMLRLPIMLEETPHPGVDMIEVRVPLLGAYVLNKAVTFQKRQPQPDEPGNPKRAKDLLYLRDLAAAGPSVTQEIQADLARMLKGDPAVQHVIDTAASRLEPIAQGGLDIEDVVQMLVEREPERSLTNARQDIRGYLTDLYEMLGELRSPAPSADVADRDE